LLIGSKRNSVDTQQSSENHEDFWVLSGRQRENHRLHNAGAKEAHPIACFVWVLCRCVLSAMVSLE
jgi:hypothetical protein